jgi:pilus assembly protein CpaC
MHPLLRLAFAEAIIWLGTAATAVADPAPTAAPIQPAAPASHDPAPVQPAAPPIREPSPPVRSDPPISVEAVQIPATGRRIVLEVGKGTLIRLARPANTVFIADPDIADVQVKSPELVYITAKSPGTTVIYAVDADNDVLLNAPVRVEFAVSDLRQSLQQIVPGALISAYTAGTNLVLSGTVADAGQVEKAQALAAAVAGGVKGSKVINRLLVATPNQVNLRVRIAEVDRNIVKELGINWSNVPSISNSVTFATTNGLTSAPTTMFEVGKDIAGAVQATISALATEGLITTLAEPNLTAVNGQTASFLAGGEIPYQVAQPGGTAGSVIFTVQFQPYGVQLAFTPTIIDANHLNLKVAPAVSELDYAHAVTVNGAVEPALTVRQAQTTVELASGQSFALAGLLMHDTSQDVSKVPWLGDIPILGALFRSNSFNNNESELVVIVTPYLVRPPEMAAASPTEGFEAPHDAQQVLWADTWRRGLPAPAQGPLDAGGSGLIGPAGFRLD